jgi:hypothetical protein
VLVFGAFLFGEKKLNKYSSLAALDFWGRTCATS